MVVLIYGALVGMAIVMIVYSLAKMAVKINIPYFTRLYLILAGLTVFLAVCLLSGCSVAYKTARDTKKLDGLAVQYPAEEARLANWLYPCFTGKAHSDTVTVKGKPDTIVTPGSTVITRVKDTVFVTKTLPGRQVDVPYYTTIHDTVENNRALSDVKLQLAAANNNVATAQQKLADTQSSQNVWRWIAIGLMVLVFGTVIWKIYKLFNGGAVTSAVSAIKKL